MATKVFTDLEKQEFINRIVEAANNFLMNADLYTDDGTDIQAVDALHQVIIDQSLGDSVTGLLIDYYNDVLDPWLNQPLTEEEKRSISIGLAEVDRSTLDDVFLAADLILDYKACNCNCQCNCCCECSTAEKF